MLVSRFVVPRAGHGTARGAAADAVNQPAVSASRGDGRDSAGAARNRGTADVLVAGAPLSAAADLAEKLAAPPISAANSPVRSRSGSAQRHERDWQQNGAVNKPPGGVQPHRRQRSADAGTPAGGGMNPAKAAADAERAARVEQHVAAGTALRKREDFAGALAEYGAALSLHPRHFKALFNRAFSLDKVTGFALCM